MLCIFFFLYAHEKRKPTLVYTVMKKRAEFVWAGRAPGLRLSVNWKRLRPASSRDLRRYHDLESAEPVKFFLFWFSSHPLAQNVPSKRTIPHGHGYYRSRSTESRSLDMIGKISLVMWLHLNQSYSNNLSMWDITQNSPQPFKLVIGSISQMQMALVYGAHLESIYTYCMDVCRRLHLGVMILLMLCLP